MARRFVDERAPSLAGDEDAYRWYASYLMRGASPGAAAAARPDERGDRRAARAPVDPRADARALPRARVPARATPATWASGSPARGSSRSPEPTICRGRARRKTFSARSSGSSRNSTTEPEPDRVLATVLVVEADGTEEACDVVRADVARFRGTELALTTDTLIATFDGPARAIRCASALMELARAVGRPPRAGLHTGEHELGATSSTASRSRSPRPEGARRAGRGPGLLDRPRPRGRLRPRLQRARAGAASGRRRAGPVARPRAGRMSASRPGVCRSAAPAKNAESAIAIAE